MRRSRREVIREFLRGGPPSAWPALDEWDRSAARLQGDAERKQRLVAMLGFGSVSRPLAGLLADVGCRRFLIADPKRYHEKSVYSQCAPEEVGCWKAEMGAQQLRAQGADVQAYVADLATLPEGLLDEHSVVVVCVDNRGADICANRWSARMRVPILKVNIEPKWGITAVRGYDFRRGCPLCMECQFTPRHYAEQWHVHSCDAAARERPTNSPRWLSCAAACLGAAAAVDLLAGGRAAGKWIGRERHWSFLSGTFADSTLVPSPTCRWDHRRFWRHLFRAAEGPATLTLRSAFAALAVPITASGNSVRSENGTWLRSCHPVCLRGRCSACQRETRRVYWIADWRQSLPPCADCGSAVLPLPFWTTYEPTLSQLERVMDEPLAHWGVAPGAVLQVHHGRRVTSLVVGSDTGPTPLAVMARTAGPRGRSKRQPEKESVQ